MFKKALEQELPYLTRRANAPMSVTVDRETRMVTFSFTSEKPVERYGYGADLPDGASSRFDEICPSDPKFWNMERVKAGVCSLLRNHNLDDAYGVVRSVKFENGMGVCTAELEDIPESDRLMNAIEKNLAGGVSYGYRPEKYTVISKAEYEIGDGENYYRKLKKKAVLRAENITLYEISARVTVPADLTVGRSIDLRSVAIEGDPGWEVESPDEPLERAKPGDLMVGDRVSWTASGGTASGSITKKAIAGTISPKPKGIPMACSQDNPGFLVRVYENDKPSDVYTVHRAASLTKTSSKSDGVTNDQSKKGTEMDLEELQAALQDALAKVSTLENEKKSLLDVKSESDTFKSRAEVLETEFKASETRYADLSKEVQLIRREQFVTVAYSNLRRKAEQLVSESKLSGKEFQELEIFSQDLEKEVQSLLKSDECDRVLDRMEFFLSKAEMRSPQLNLKSALKDEPLTTDGNQPTEADIQARAEKMLAATSTQRVVI